MADVRALLAAERQSRRITHPHLTYTKSGALICNICNLNVKSEKLWEGHLRSLNHRKNAQKTQAPAQEVLPSTTKTLKRKLDDVDEEEEDEHERLRVTDTGRRKIPKSRATSLAEKDMNVTEDIRAVPSIPQQADVEVDEPPPPPPAQSVVTNHTAEPQKLQPQINEDEYAAFEREIASLDNNETAAPDYAAATISAAPVSAEELAAQQAEERRKQQETLAEDEVDEERGRLEEEFEIMEEFEERVKRLKEKREQIRAGVAVASGGTDAADAAAAAVTAGDVEVGEERVEGEKEQEGDGSSRRDSVGSRSGSGSDSSDDEEEDDWYS